MMEKTGHVGEERKTRVDGLSAYMSRGKAHQQKDFYLRNSLMITLYPCQKPYMAALSPAVTITIKMIWPTPGAAIRMPLYACTNP